MPLEHEPPYADTVPELETEYYGEEEFLRWVPPLVPPWYEEIQESAEVEQETEVHELEQFEEVSETHWEFLGHPCPFRPQPYPPRHTPDPRRSDLKFKSRDRRVDTLEPGK